VVSLIVGPDAANAAGMMANDATFKGALAQVDSNSVAAIYVNVEKILALIDKAPVGGPRQQRDRANWNKAKDVLGLKGIKTAIWTGAFDGKDWSSKAFVAAPAPRTGLVSILEGRPVGDDVLKLVPSTAVMCAAGNLDLAKFVASIKDAVGQMDPQAPQKIAQALDQFRTMTGLDLEKDVLAPLGDQWAVYTDPTVAGAYSFGATLVNKLKDPAKAEQSFVQLGRAVTNIITGAMGRSGMMIAIRDVQSGGSTIHYLATPIVRPSWTIKDGVLYVGLYPQVVASAIARAAAPDRKSILENEQFTALRKRLGGGNVAATSVRYVDLPKTAPTIYPTWLVISSYAGFADLFGAPSPAMLMPPLSDLMGHLAPAGQISWVDDKGWHAHAISPFPGSQILGSDPTMSVAAPALMASILLPSLNRARETANRVKCSSNERQIGQAMLLYSNDNRGKYPPDLGTLIKTQDITIDVFVCPSSPNAIPAEVRGAPLDVQAAWVNANANYVYAGAGLNNATPADRPVLYEKAGDHDQDGMNILYGDGHVEWQAMPTAQQEIQKVGGQVR
jgi:prepilin-type processing-associated H-X9-DG protein